MKWDCISLELWAKIKYGSGQIIIKSNLYKLGFVVSLKMAPKNISSRLWKYLMFVKLSDHVRWNVNSTFSDKLMAPRCSFSFAEEKTFQSRLTYWMLCVKYASTWVLLSNFYAPCTMKRLQLIPSDSGSNQLRQLIWHILTYNWHFCNQSDDNQT